MATLEAAWMRHSRSRASRAGAEARHRLRGRCVIAVATATATAALAAPGAALAANPPTITAAGITAADQLYVAWTVAPGTTFDFVTLSTVPDPDPADPTFFAPGNFAGFCDPVIASPTCTATSYVASYPTGRDRRYFAKVSAQVTGTSTYLASAVWVIDDAKPQIAGAANPGTIPATGPAVAGHPLGSVAPPPVAPPPPPPAPAAVIKLLSPPKTISALVSKSVRIQIACSVTCSTFGRLTLGSPTIGTKSFTLAGGGVRTVTVKPSSKGRKRLRGRSRARIKIVAAVSPFGGTTKKVTKSFTVRR
jgi:hypothetical protein